MNPKSFNEIDLAAMVYTVGIDLNKDNLADSAGNADGANNQVLKGDAFIEAVAKLDFNMINLFMQTMTAEQLRAEIEKLSPEERAKYEAAIKEGKAEGYTVNFAAERKVTINKAKAPEKTDKARTDEA